MTLLKKLISNKLFLIFVFLHIIFFSINYAEWGDTYRILRASEYVRDFSYPTDEKRPPLFSIILAIRPDFVDQVFWGRVVMFSISIGFFILYSEFLNLFKLNEKAKNLALWLLVFNPIFLYWSLRIYADLPFTFITLLIFYLYMKWKTNLEGYKRPFLLGILLGLAVLTRFEGYILGLSLGFGILMQSAYDTSKKFKLLISLGTGFLVSAGFWLFYRNPFYSFYFEEPADRIYDFKTLIIFIASFLFAFGFAYAPYFFIQNINKVATQFKREPALILFIVLELSLALLWPAAIPRLLLPALPFIIVYLAKYLVEYFDNPRPINKNKFVLFLSLFIIYVVAQGLLKLQFLVLIKSFFVFVVILQPAILYFIVTKNYSKFRSVLYISMIVWSFSTIFLHKDIFKPLVKANKYTIRNVEGVIAYNDVTSVSDWYLNHSKGATGVRGVYLNMDAKKGRTYEILRQHEVDYLLITNEHNSTLEFDAKDTKYLEEIEEFRYTIRGKEFFTKLVKFVR